MDIVYNASWHKEMKGSIARIMRHDDGTKEADIIHWALFRLKGLRI